jgi:hypothetical protein
VYIREEYNQKSNYCINGKPYDATGYYCARVNRFVRCHNPYCNIHGFDERRIRAWRWEQNLKPYELHHWLTIHFGETTKDKNKRKSISRLRQEIGRLNIPHEICIVPHWQYGKKNRHKLFQHWHLCISANEVIEKKTIKELLTKAATANHCNSASRIRLGYKVRDNCQSFVVYSFRIGIYRYDLVLPPPGVRREFARNPQKRRTKKTTFSKMSISVGMQGVVKSQNQIQ